MAHTSPLPFSKKRTGIAAWVTLTLLFPLVLTQVGCERPRHSQPRKTEQGDFSQLSDEECVRMLGHRSPIVRRQVVAELAGRGERVVPRLSKLLTQEGNLPAKAGAAEALAKIGPRAQGALSALVQAAKDQTWPDRYLASVALGEIGQPSPEAVSTLVQLLRSDPEERVRSAAARALGRTGKGSSPSAEVITALLQALKDSDLTVRAEAAEALGLCAPPTSEVIQALEAAAQSQDFALRQAAEQALVEIHSRQQPKR